MKNVVKNTKNFKKRVFLFKKIKTFINVYYNCGTHKPCHAAAESLDVCNSKSKVGKS